MSRQSDASLAVKTVKKLMQTLWCHSSQLCFFFFVLQTSHEIAYVKASLLSWSYKQSYQHIWDDDSGWKPAETSEDGFPVKVSISYHNTPSGCTVYNHLYQFWMNRNVQFHTTIHVLWKTQWSTYARQNGNTKSQLGSPKKIQNPTETSFSWELQNKKKYKPPLGLLITNIFLKFPQRRFHFKRPQLE